MPVYVPNASDHFLDPGCGNEFSPVSVSFSLLAFGPALPSAFGPSSFVEPLCTGGSGRDHTSVLSAFHESRPDGTAEKR